METRPDREGSLIPRVPPRKQRDTDEGVRDRLSSHGPFINLRTCNCSVNASELLRTH